jgi:hypothetical protein
MVTIFFSYSLGQLATTHEVYGSSASISQSTDNVQYFPMNPMQQKAEQLRQNYLLFEQKLAMSSPQEQQYLVSIMQQNLFNNLVQANPADRAQFIQMLQQVMSPPLQQILLIPVVLQLNGGVGNPGLNLPQQGSGLASSDSPQSNGPSIEESQRSIQESQRKTEQIQGLIEQWDRMYPPSWADSFGAMGD